MQPSMHENLTENDPHRWIAALRQSHNHLVALVQPLSPEQLRGPSYHSWSLAEVFGHLGSQAEIFSAWLTVAVDGTEPPGREFMQPIWDAWNSRSPDNQVADSIKVNEQLVQRFERLSDDELARMHLSLFGLELDAVGLPRLRLSEHAVHTWDVAVALDPAALVQPDAVALLIDTLSALARRAGKPQGKRFRLQVRTSQPERELALNVGDEVELTTWADGANDGELRIPAEAFLRLVYGRMDANHTPPIEMTSAGVSLDDLRRVFPGA